tara:strand:- start:3566 stop:3811 length:246 start_codon:yes stop_codon:yes gene_type:complete
LAIASSALVYPHEVEHTAVFATGAGPDVKDITGLLITITLLLGYTLKRLIFIEYGASPVGLGQPYSSFLKALDVVKPKSVV